MQKFKMLLLVELLTQESDEDHPITTQRLIDKLTDYDISCDRRTLARDISQLKERKYPIKSVKLVYWHNEIYTNDIDQNH